MHSNPAVAPLFWDHGSAVRLLSLKLAFPPLCDDFTANLCEVHGKCAARETKHCFSVANACTRYSLATEIVLKTKAGGAQHHHQFIFFLVKTQLLFNTRDPSTFKLE